MDNLTKEKRSWNMSKIRSKDSELEIKFRKILWKNKIRYRKNVSGMKGKPDLVFKKFKIVLFIDSCFWHKCPIHGHLPKSNIGFWNIKLEKNKRRDTEINKYYKKNGWESIRIWEHELDQNFQKKAKEVLKKLQHA